MEGNDSVKNEYCKYMKPEFGRNGPGNPVVVIGILLFLFFVCIWAWVSGDFFVSILCFIALVWLSGSIIRIYSAARKEYHCLLASPEVSAYVFDFSKSDSFYEDRFRIGDRGLYIAHGAAPLNYEDIQKVYVEVTKSDMETRTLTIMLKKSYEKKAICYLPKSAWKPGPEQNQWNEIINRINSRIQPDPMGLSYDMEAEADTGKRT